MSETQSVDLRAIIASARVIAVLGAHPDPTRPAFYVPQDLKDAGARLLPVNAQRVGESLWGEPIRATLAELNEAVDVVDVFRRAEHLHAHLDDVLAMRPLPRVVWLQAGIEDETFAQSLRDVGITVVQNRCMLADRRRLAVEHIR
jgi:predicted CoA-binding protein